MFYIDRVTYELYQNDKNFIVSSFEIHCSENYIYGDSVKISESETAEIQKESINRLLSKYEIGYKYLNLVSTIYYDYLDSINNWDKRFLSWENSNLDYYMINTDYAILYGKFVSKETLMLELNSKNNRKVNVLDVKTGRLVNVVVKDIDLVVS